jgi:hypothetical protein
LKFGSKLLLGLKLLLVLFVFATPRFSLVQCRKLKVGLGDGREEEEEDSESCAPVV